MDVAGVTGLKKRGTGLSGSRISTGMSRIQSGTSVNGVSPGGDVGGIREMDVITEGVKSGNPATQEQESQQTQRSNGAGAGAGSAGDMPQPGAMV